MNRRDFIALTPALAVASTTAWPMAVDVEPVGSLRQYGTLVQHSPGHRLTLIRYERKMADGTWQPWVTQRLP